MIRLGCWFRIFCHVLVQQGAGYSTRVGAPQLESAWVEHHRNGGPSKVFGKLLKKDKFQRQSEWPLIPYDQDLKSN